MHYRETSTELESLLLFLISILMQQTFVEPFMCESHSSMAHRLCTILSRGWGQIESPEELFKQIDVRVLLQTN